MTASRKIAVAELGMRIWGRVGPNLGRGYKRTKPIKEFVKCDVYVGGVYACVRVFERAVERER